MKPITQLQIENAKANQIWRFYKDSASKWRWEKLAFDGTAVEVAPSGYEQYEDCLASATKRGYVLLPSLSNKTESVQKKAKRSYIRFSKR
jgi:hypothetical protein